jgi:CheY-like chemotaxis protein
LAAHAGDGAEAFADAAVADGVEMDLEALGVQSGHVEEFRRSARALLEADGYAVVGEACDGDEAIAEAGRLRPEIVLLDIQFPGIGGFAVAERPASSAHTTAVVLISSRDARSYEPRLDSAAARGVSRQGRPSGHPLQPRELSPVRLRVLLLGAFGGGHGL